MERKRIFNFVMAFFMIALYSACDARSVDHPESTKTIQSEIMEAQTPIPSKPSQTSKTSQVTPISSQPHPKIDRNLNDILANAFEQSSFRGDCWEDPNTMICLKFSDGYIWFVKDKIARGYDIFLWNGKFLEVIRGQKVDYYHILETDYVVQVDIETGKSIYVTPVPSNVAESHSVLPTQTLSFQQTPISDDSPCYRFKLISDVTYSDKTIVEPGSIFLKIWRFQNTGSCYWTSMGNSPYQLKFAHGDKMNGPYFALMKFFPPGNIPKLELTDPGWNEEIEYVAPGDIVDVPVFLRAPDEPGIYKGYWQMLNEQKNVIDTFWVEIEVTDDLSIDINNWSGVWFQFEPDLSDGYGSTLVTYQFGPRVSGYYYDDYGDVVLIDGNIFENGTQVHGSYGVPGKTKSEFKWFMLENKVQFQGYFYCDFSGTKDAKCPWCGGRDNYAPPQQCNYQD